MRNIVIGTSGHIDHGKTTLIKCLTNIDTHKSKEERERGMTIDLGFSYLTLPNNNKISIIDVPGHEKFIKNMVSGCNGIDFVLFLIACDDGIMPQTIEHKNILKLLNINKGIIILSKRDLVSQEQVELLKKDISKTFDDNFFSNFPILEFSEKDPLSHAKLYKEILFQMDNISKETKNSDNSHFKLYIDKSYSIKGLGTIVSGTTKGDLSLGDFLMLYPHKKIIKVKSIENHCEPLENIQSGKRCALNISNISLKDVSRGNFLSKTFTIESSKVIHTSFENLKKKIPKNGTKVRVHFGTGEFFGRIKYLHDSFEEYSLFQIVMDKSIFIEKNEIGLIRSLESLEILGSIKVLKTNASLIKKNNFQYINELLDKNLPPSFQDDLKVISKEIYKYISIFHEKNSLSFGVPLATLKNKFFPDKDKTFFYCALDFFSKENLFLIKENEIANLNFKIKLNKEEKELKEKIFKHLKNKKFSGETYSKLISIFKDYKSFKPLFNYLIKTGIITTIDSNTYILSGFLKEAIKLLKIFLEENKKITLPEFRDLISSNRETALQYLNFFDSERITLNVDNIRKLK